ncbi:MAG: YcxB family protein [Armatimonadota bacterium]
MQIAYENTDEDAVAWNYVRLTKTAAGRKAQKNLRVALTLSQILIGVIGYLLFCLLVGLSVNLSLLVLCAGLAGALGYGAQTLQFRRVIRRQVKPLKKNGYFTQFLGPKQVTISPEGIQTFWPEGHFLRRWSSLIRVEDAEDHLLFVYGDVDFSIIPKRAFRDAVHQQEFLVSVERFRAGAGAIDTGGALPLSGSVSAPWWRNRYTTDTQEEPLNVRRGYSQE